MSQSVPWRDLSIEARRIGLSDDQFWALTLREWFREQVIARRRDRDDLDRRIAQAWFGVRIYLEAMNKKRLRPLSVYLTDAGQAQTEEQMRAAVQVIKQQFARRKAGHGR